MADRSWLMASLGHSHEPSAILTRPSCSSGSAIAAGAWPGRAFARGARWRGPRGRRGVRLGRRGLRAVRRPRRARPARAALAAGCSAASPMARGLHRCGSGGRCRRPDCGACVGMDGSRERDGCLHVTRAPTPRGTASARRGCSGTRDAAGVVRGVRTSLSDRRGGRSPASVRRSVVGRWRAPPWQRSPAVRRPIPARDGDARCSPAAPRLSG